LNSSPEELQQNLLDVLEARRRLLENFVPLDLEAIHIGQAVGRRLAENIISPLDLPQFANSAMDGFAVRSEDALGATQENPVKLDVVGDIPAGTDIGVTLGAGQAVRIMTGAPIPDGADAIVPVENTDFDYREVGVQAPKEVEIKGIAREGDHIRGGGEDVSAGEMVMQPGELIRPQNVGFLASLGITEICVYRKPRIAIFSAGDELLPPNVPLAPGKIYDANRYTLISLVVLAGGVPVDLGIVADNKNDVCAILDKAASSRVDLILSSAGVSVGSFDFVRSVVEEYGQLEFWKVNMRPGKPVAFGFYKDTPFIGLPGNPVSAFVGYEVFVRSVLIKMSGVQEWKRTMHKVQITEPIESDGRESYLRAVVSRQDDCLSAKLTGHQGSGNLRSLVQANALLIIPAGLKYLSENSLVDTWLFDDVFEY